jgi:3-hydroxyisobutyrate dehydrogenase-like beta-hydroxyacid dehydrogenase
MIAVVGLGNIGLAIARRLVVRGRDVIGIDLDPGRRNAWLAMTGLQAAEDLEAVNWDDIDTVFVIVRMADQAEDVLRKLSSLESSAPRTAYVVSTLDEAVSSRLGAYNTESLRVLELPVSGGEIGAMAGKLAVMIAGPVTDDDEAFILSTIATQVVRFDAYGEPTLAKLFNNVLGAYNASAFAQMLILARERGLDPARLYRVILASSGGSWMAGGFLELLDDLLAKDVELLRSHLGELPEIELDGDFAKTLSAARAALTPAASA